MTREQMDRMESLNSEMFLTDEQERELRVLLDIANKEGRANYDMFRPYISFDPD